MKPPPRLRTLAIGSLALTVLGAVFGLYLRPELAFTLANQLWACF